MKNIKESFNKFLNKVVNQPKRCVQCDDDDCSKCKGNQNSFDSVFAERNDEPVPPIPDCGGFNYLLLVDSNCNYFNSGNCDWSIDDGINGQQPYLFGWDTYMNTFYNGSGNVLTNIVCPYSTYILKKFGTKPPQFTIIDSNCNSTNRNFIQICSNKCWRISFYYDDVNCTFDSIYLLPGIIIPFNSGANPFTNVSLFQTYITNSLWGIYSQGSFAVVSANSTTKIVEITMNYIYTFGIPQLTINCGSQKKVLPFVEIPC